MTTENDTLEYPDGREGDVVETNVTIERITEANLYKLLGDQPQELYLGTDENGDMQLYRRSDRDGKEGKGCLAALFGTR